VLGRDGLATIHVTLHTICRLSGGPYLRAPGHRYGQSVPPSAPHWRAAELSFRLEGLIAARRLSPKGITS